MSSDAWDTCGPPAGHAAPTPPPSSAAATSATSRKYVTSLLAVVAVLLTLWIVRPPFVCRSGKGMRTPQVQAGSVLILAVLAGAAVLVAPLCRPVVQRIGGLLPATTRSA
tara:strand:+ start:468 stop:797 length:330 start_codon:yes stop_codon:yes gene_type:complete